MAGNSEDNSQVSVSQLQGEFSIKSTKYTVHLTDSLVSWEKIGAKKKNVTEVPIRDIVSVKTAASKSSNTGTIDSWILCYAQRKKKHHLSKTTVVFTGDQNSCQEWTNKIQQLLDTVDERPKHILVFINPISGWKSGEKNYKSKVAPLFAEANIYTDVKVTERANHPEEILATYDLTTIDSIVSVGGDGMYSEVANGLLKRVVKDSNTNLNDPQMDLPPVEIPIGIIPCGTGNGIADSSNGCVDVETAALSIIIGKRNRANVEGVYCGGEFLIFSILLVGCGVWGEIIDSTERRRNLGVFRYPVVLIKELLVKAPRSVTLNIRYKVFKPNKTAREKENGTDGAESVDKDQPADSKGGAVDGEGDEWVTVEKEFVGPMSLNMNAFGDSIENVQAAMAVLAIKPCTRMQMLKFFSKLAQRDLGADLDFVDKYETTEYTVRVVNPSDPGTHNGRMEHLLDLDGEVLMLKKPEYTVKLFSRKLQLFASVPEDYFIPKHQT